MSDLHDRVASALGWTPTEARSLSMQSLRDLVRPVNPDLANELSLAIQSGAYIGEPARAGKTAAIPFFRITVGPVTQTPPNNVTFGKQYGRPYRAGRKIVWMFRKGQKVRWF